MSKPSNSPSQAGNGISHNPTQSRHRESPEHNADWVNAMRGMRLLKNLPKAPPLAGAFEPPSQPGAKSKRTPLQIGALRSPTSLGSGALTPFLPSHSSSSNQATVGFMHAPTRARPRVNSLPSAPPRARAVDGRIQPITLEYDVPFRSEAAQPYDPYQQSEQQKSVTPPMGGRTTHSSQSSPSVHVVG